MNINVKISFRTIQLEKDQTNFFRAVYPKQLKTVKTPITFNAFLTEHIRKFRKVTFFKNYIFIFFQ
jgi:hypothetical protein